eukprot:1270777-Amphidinium_carterae.1
MPALLSIESGSLIVWTTVQLLLFNNHVVFGACKRFAAGELLEVLNNLGVLDKAQIRVDLTIELALKNLNFLI